MRLARSARLWLYLGVFGAALVAAGTVAYLGVNRYQSATADQPGTACNGIAVSVRQAKVTYNTFEDLVNNPVTFRAWDPGSYFGVKAYKNKLETAYLNLIDGLNRADSAFAASTQCAKESYTTLEGERATFNQLIASSSDALNRALLDDGTKQTLSRYLLQLKTKYSKPFPRPTASSGTTSGGGNSGSGGGTSAGTGSGTSSGGATGGGGATTGGTGSGTSSGSSGGTSGGSVSGQGGASSGGGASSSGGGTVVAGGKEVPIPTVTAGGTAVPIPATSSGGTNGGSVSGQGGASGGSTSGSGTTTGGGNGTSSGGTTASGSGTGATTGGGTNSSSQATGTQPPSATVAQATPGSGGASNTAGSNQIKLPDPVKLTNWLNVSNLRELITTRIPELLIGFIGLVSISIFFWNAWQYLVINAGDADATAERKRGMLFALVGAVIAAAAYAILEFAQGLISL